MTGGSEPLLGHVAHVVDAGSGHARLPSVILDGDVSGFPRPRDAITETRNDAQP